MKILFLVPRDRYFWTHRLSLARKIRNLGAKVVIMTPVGDCKEEMQREGFHVIPWRLSRGSLNPLHELSAFGQVVWVYRRERPDLVHHVALKAVVYGGLAARLCGNICCVNAVAGLGHVFSDRGWKMRALRRVLSFLLRLAVGGKWSRTIIQNQENQDVLVKAGVLPLERAVVIPGVGVNLKEFSPQPPPLTPPAVVLVGRMLWEKGIGEFVEAARILRQQGASARFILVGEPDPGNPGTVTEAQLLSWNEAGVVEWWRHRGDMPAVYARASLVCLPTSYGEGVPKALIEAAACGRAIVTTDVPGCRDVVRDGYNGLLVPEHNSDALAQALATLLKDPALRAQMGSRGREIALQRFSEEKAIGETLSVYHELLGQKWAEVPASAFPHREPKPNARFQPTQGKTLATVFAEEYRPANGTDGCDSKAGDSR